MASQVLLKNDPLDEDAKADRCMMEKEHFHIWLSWVAEAPEPNRIGDSPKDNPGGDHDCHTCRRDRRHLSGVLLRFLDDHVAVDVVVAAAAGAAVSGLGPKDARRNDGEN